MSKNTIPQSLNFIDVFSGAGGLSCGLELAGHRCVLGVDADKYAIETFKENHKSAKTYCGDIRKLDKKQLSELLGGQTVHAIVGGPPCQGFSTVGPGNPKDERNGLFLQFVRLVKETNPQFVIIENVTGLLAKKNEKTLKAIFKKFEGLGYHLDVRVMSAEHYGVPEKRRRTIIIGTKLDVPVIFPEITHKSPVTVGEALQNLAANKKGDIYNHDIEAAQLKNDIDKQRLQKIPEGKGVRYEADEKKYFNTKALKLGVNWQELPEGRFRQTKYMRLDGKLPSPTIMTHRQSYYHPTETRYLTQREAAKIQSFPNNFKFVGPVSAQWRQIGNAVPPLLGKALGKALIEMIKLDGKSEVKTKKKAPNLNNVRSRAFVYQEKRSEAR